MNADRYHRCAEAASERDLIVIRPSGEIVIYRDGAVLYRKKLTRGEAKAMGMDLIGFCLAE